MNAHSEPVERTDPLTGGRIQSVVRALMIVDTVAADVGPMRAKDIAQLLDLHVATAAHLISTLVHMGYLEREDPGYVLGRRKFLSLASKVELDLRPTPLHMNLLRRVVESTGETCYISTLRKDTVSMDVVLEGSFSVRVAGLSVGAIGDIHSRAAGKVLLAFSDDSRRVDLLFSNGQLTARTSNTITERSRLEDELQTTRLRKYAVDNEEFVMGIGGIAVALYEGEQFPRRALSVTIPIHRFQDPVHFQKVRDALLSASAISAEQEV